ncbi:MAG: hypothetical protein U0169_04270 [Polyangiaceae bacterium]
MKRREKLIASLTTRPSFNSSPNEELLLARVLRRRLRSGKFITRASVSAEAFKHGIEMSEDRINIFLDELVADGVDETVTPAGERMYILARAISHGNRAKQGESETVTLSTGALSKKGARAYGGPGGHREKDLVRSLPHRSRRPSGKLGQPADAGGESPNDQTAIAAWRSAHAALGGDPNVKCIAPLHLDGGTSFRINAPVAGWDLALRRLARPGRPPRTIDLIDGQTGEVLTAWVGRCDVLKGINIIFSDDAQLRVVPRTGQATLIAKSGALWRDGASAWMSTWLDRVTRWLTGGACPSPLHAAALGWSTVHLELASDFTGLTLFHDDAQRFIKGGGDVEAIRSRNPRADGQAETINIGSRAEDRLALSTHDKSGQLRSKKRNPATSVYAPTWAVNEWDGEASVRRVEVRGNGRALNLIALEDPTVTLDLTDPASLLDHAVLGAFWLHATMTRTRLRAPDAETTDPRWLAVQAAGGIARPQVRFAQVPRDQTRRLDLAERRELAEREAARKLGSALGLSGTDSLEELLARLIERSEYKAALRVSASSARDDVRATLGEHPQDEDAHMFEPGEHIASEIVHCPTAKCPSAGDDGSGA